MRSHIANENLFTTATEGVKEDIKEFQLVCQVARAELRNLPRFMITAAMSATPL